MNGEVDFHIPDCKEFCRGYKIYNKRERRGPIYFEALTIVQQNWGNPILMAQGIQRLIRAWNRFYANFDLNELSNCLNRNMTTLSNFRNRDISTLSDDDSETIRNLFIQFLDALKRTNDNRKSPVSVAKALSPIATHFFPLWDSNIAFAYRCFYFADAVSSYIKFCHKMKLLSEKVRHCVPNPDDRSLLKRIDEYNYSKYTMHWILK